MEYSSYPDSDGYGIAKIKPDSGKEYSTRDRVEISNEESENLQQKL